VEEMSEALKKQKMENNLVKITLILNFRNTQETHVMIDHCFFNSIYKMREMPQELKSSPVIPIYKSSPVMPIYKSSPVIPIYKKLTNKMWKTIEELTYYMYVINYVVKF
jgi:hypothetical protein